MWLLLLEAFLAMMVLVFIVWWTMFSGRQPDPVNSEASNLSNDSKAADTPDDGGRK